MANAVLLRRKMQNMDREPGTNQGTIWRMKQTSRLLIRTRAQGLLWRNHWNHQSSLARVKMTTWIKGFWEELHNKCITRELQELWSPASESQPLRFSLPSAAPRQEEAACPPHFLPQSTDLTVWRQWQESVCAPPAVLANALLSSDKSFQRLPKLDCLRASSHS